LSNSNIDETILRTVGKFAVASDQAAASEIQVGAFGLILVSDAAVAVGITAIPGPITDSSDDGWFVYVPIVQSVEFISAVGVRPDWATCYDFDSKAKRKIEEGRQLAIVVENAHASFGFEITFAFRLLSMVSGT